MCEAEREREREKERERENQGGRESLIWCQKQSALHTLRLFMTRPTAQVITESKILKNPTAENVPLQVKTGCVHAVDSSTCIMIMCCHLPTIVNSVRMMPMRELGIAAFTHFLKPRSFKGLSLPSDSTIHPTRRSLRHTSRRIYLWELFL